MMKKLFKLSKENLWRRQLILPFFQYQLFSKLVQVTLLSHVIKNLLRQIDFFGFYLTYHYFDISLKERQKSFTWQVEACMHLIIW